MNRRQMFGAVAAIAAAGMFSASYSSARRQEGGGREAEGREEDGQVHGRERLQGEERVRRRRRARVPHSERVQGEGLGHGRLREGVRRPEGGERRAERAEEVLTRAPVPRPRHRPAARALRRGARGRGRVRLVRGDQRELHGRGRAREEDPPRRPRALPDDAPRGVARHRRDRPDRRGVPRRAEGARRGRGAGVGVGPPLLDERGRAHVARPAAAAVHGGVARERGVARGARAGAARTAARPRERLELRALPRSRRCRSGSSWRRWRGGAAAGCCST